MNQTSVIGKFIPTMQPSYATPEEVMQAHGTTFADVKYDGYRVQLHKSKHGLVIYTRNGNELNYTCYPDVLRLAEKLPLGIFEAELVGEGASHKEVFDHVKARFRRRGLKEETVQDYLRSGIVKEIPLSLRLFDVLCLEGNGMMSVPYEIRRAAVEALGMRGLEPVETEKITSQGELEALLSATFKGRQEGRVCKNPSSLYLPGKETIDWVKFKRSETLDLAVVGFYQNENYSNDLPFTSVLCAAYNEKTGLYETLGKIGVTRNGLAHEIQAQVGQHIKAWRSNKVAFSEKLSRPAYERFVPDVFIDPDKSLVMEVKAMNLQFTDNWQTCGYKEGKAFSMRIGYAHQLRPDKSPKQATKTSTIRTLYKLQEGE